MKKIFILSALLLVSFISSAQTLICWRAELVKYNSSTGEFVATQRYDMNSEAFFSDNFIRINDAGLYLTKTRIASKNSSDNGTVTIYDVSDDKGVSWVVTVVEDINGIFKIFITKDNNSNEGTVYYIKNR